MFVPPENREFGPPPSDKRELTKRERTVVTWLLAVIVMSFVLAPIGGSTVLEALWYLLTR